MESRHSVQSTSVSYGGIGEIQKDVPNSRPIYDQRKKTNL